MCKTVVKEYNVGIALGITRLYHVHGDYVVGTYYYNEAQPGRGIQTWLRRSPEVL